MSGPERHVAFQDLLEGKPIPANGDGENHPDVRALRHSMSDYANVRLARAGDFAALAVRVGGDATRLKAAYDYIVSRDR